MVLSRRGETPQPEATDEMFAWYASLRSPGRAAVDAAVDKLHELGVGLGRPTADGVKASRLGVRELRAAETLRIFYKFDPRGVPILLTGGDKKGQDSDRWYRRMAKEADGLYDVHIAELQSEGALRAAAPPSPRQSRSQTAGMVR